MRIRIWIQANYRNRDFVNIFTEKPDKPSLYPITRSDGYLVVCRRRFKRLLRNVVRLPGPISDKTVSVNLFAEPIKPVEHAKHAKHAKHVKTVEL